MNKSAQRFNQIADNFLNSEVHKASPSIDQLKMLLGEVHDKAICDVACGSGHLGLALAPHSLTSVDPSESMLANVEKLAATKGKSVKTVCAYAEDLPFDSEQFDIVVTRLAAHHFTDIALAIKEMKRVTKKGGTIAIIDLEGYEDKQVDQFNHELELLHDETHIKSYSYQEWLNLFTHEDLTVVEGFSDLSEKPGGISIKRWCEIASSGWEAEREIRAKLEQAPAHFLKTMGIEKREDDFYIPVRTAMFLVTK